MAQIVDWKVVAITEQDTTVSFKIETSYLPNTFICSFDKELVTNVNFNDMLMSSVLLKIRDKQTVISLSELNNNYLDIAQQGDMEILPYSPPYTIPISNVVNQFISTSISAYTESTLLSYTVPVGKTFYFRNVTIGGDADGIFRIKINNVDKLVIRNSATERTLLLNQFYSNIPLEAGTSIVITCENTYSTARTFESIILGYEVNA